MKLQTYQETIAPVANALSVSLSEKENVSVNRARDSVKEEEDLWQEITDELASDSAPLWRMWR
jgi:hypothetical protein